MAERGLIRGGAALHDSQCHDCFSDASSRSCGEKTICMQLPVVPAGAGGTPTT